MPDPAPHLLALDVASLDDVFGFGVAGNFAGHLEQAGEASDFTNVVAAASMPKGIFPWYAAGVGTFLETFPMSSSELAVPGASVAPRIQIEPEVGMLAAVTYDGDGRVVSLAPQALLAFDDCSVRREGATKISHKKNWGAGSKGVAARAFEVTDLSVDGLAGSLRLASFLQRDEQLHPYGVDSAVATYTLFGDALLDWLVDRLNEQRELPGTPLEDVGALLRQAGAPDRVLVGVGATRYEPYGESTFVEPGDEALVVVYDERRHTPDQVAAALAARRDDELEHASVLRRRAAAV
jgi:hypothetical protein